MDPEGRSRTGIVPPEAGGAGPTDPGGLKPPGVDLSPAERQRRVKKHLSAGKAALAGAGLDADEAGRQARLALAVDETSVDAMVLLAHANIEKRYYDQALDVLDKAAERGGARVKEVHFLLGVVYDETEEPDKAFDAYRRAVALAPTYPSALMNLGVHYLANQRYLDARSVYEKLTGSLGYATAASLTNLGSAYRGLSAELGATDVNQRNQMILRAEQTYKRAIAKNKTYANAYYNLGLLYLDSDPYPVAGGREMDNLARLKRAKSYFDQYRRLPGADTRRVDEIAATADKLITREERLREMQRKREARDKARGDK
jgi:tetratricopeptide (TPR) repeat protein